MHLMGSNRELVSALYTTRDRLQFERLSNLLLAKVSYLATVIDRILGLPEGSIELADRGALEMLGCTLDSPPTAA